MRGLSLFIIGFLICVLTHQAYAARQLALKLVAATDSQIVTSRDVEANYIIDRALYSDKGIPNLSLGTEEFVTAMSRLLVEIMVSDEATVFEVAKVSDDEVTGSFKRVKQKIQENAGTKARWNHLAVSDSDLRALVLRKMRANRFIKYKSNSSYVEPSEAEAREYFNKNRLKFGTMEFENFKASILKYLGRKNAEERLRDWFEILRKKHRVKNYLAGSQYGVSSSSSN